MKILHYSLGIPGFRSGGLTKYSIDLMIEENKTGNDVFLLYPGEMKKSKKSFIKEDKIYNGIKVFELINPLPVPLTNGVSEPDLYYVDRLEFKSYFKNWIGKEKFDIVHIHTLMGLPIEFVDAIKELGIKIVYTTHDYYGICPKVNLVRCDGSICNDNTDYSACYNCCKNGLSYNKIKIMQSKLYRNVKKSNWGKRFISSVKGNINKKEVSSQVINKCDNVEVSNEIKDKYKSLHEYYYNILKKIDYYHFNSNITKKVYENYLGDINGEVISITHSNIKDNRHIKKFNTKLKIIFLGNDSIYKGLNQLITALKGIDKSLENLWSLDIWGAYGESDFSNITYKGKYDYSMLENIFEEADLLVIPSIWHETFGFIGLEAYSYGVPILATKLVGFNDLIQDEITGFIVDADVESIKRKIISLVTDREQLVYVNKNICEIELDFQMEFHVSKILELYKNVNRSSL